MSKSESLVAPGFGGVADAFYRTIAGDSSGGAALSVWVDGSPVVDLWAGLADARTEERFGPDTLSVIFSCTKGLASLLIAMLIESGEMPGWDTPVAAIWPEFGAHGKDRVTIGEALAHRGGLSAPRHDLSRQEALDDLVVADALAAQEPLWAPGENHQYHTLTHGAITSKLVMLATGTSIGKCFAERIADPLRAEAWIGLPESEEHRVSFLVEDPPPPIGTGGDPESVYWAERAANLYGPVSLATSFNEPELHRVALAGAGGIATARALASVWSATVTETNGVRLIDDGTVDDLRKPRSAGAPRFNTGPPPYQSWGAGVMVPSDWQRYLSPSSFGHDGAGGQVAFADLEAKGGFAYLTNRMTDHWARGQSVVAALKRALG